MQVGAVETAIICMAAERARGREWTLADADRRGTRASSLGGGVFFFLSQDIHLGAVCRAGEIIDRGWSQGVEPAVLGDDDEAGEGFWACGANAKPKINKTDMVSATLPGLGPGKRDGAQARRQQGRRGRCWVQMQTSWWWWWWWCCASIPTNRQ